MSGSEPSSLQARIAGRDFLPGSGQEYVWGTEATGARATVTSELSARTKDGNGSARLADTYA